MRHPMRAMRTLTLSEYAHAIYIYYNTVDILYSRIADVRRPTTYGCIHPSDPISITATHPFPYNPAIPRGRVSLTE